MVDAEYTSKVLSWLEILRDAQCTAYSAGAHDKAREYYGNWKTNQPAVHVT
jgi:hypothetical protein